jgi:hypothetical protein
LPEAVVNMFTPDFPIEAIEVIIMSCNFTRVKLYTWLDHGFPVSDRGCGGLSSAAVYLLQTGLRRAD